MRAPSPLLRFSPAAAEPADLESIFVARTSTVTSVLDSIAESVRGAGGATHHLFIGQRGMGKTHLVSLIANRVIATYPAAVDVAWLDEDPWRIRGYPSLLAAILQSLDVTPRQSRLEDSAREHEDAISARLALRPMIVVIENLDEVLDRISLDGRQRLRAFLENRRNVSLLCTSTVRPPEITRLAEPFFGFFDVLDLDELTLAEATELLQKVARREENYELARYLATESAASRLRVVDQLAGGHPRVWMMLSSCLNIANVDELVPLFIRSLDDLTPYYQQRIAALAPDQQTITLALVDSKGAVTVQALADRTGIEAKSLSSQLKKLAAKGLVQQATISIESTGDRRAAFYELREPLMRMCLDIKVSRGRPLEVVVQFLRARFGPKPDGHSSEVWDDTVSPELWLAQADAISTKHQINQLAHLMTTNPAMGTDPELWTALQVGPLANGSSEEVAAAFAAALTFHGVGLLTEFSRPKRTEFVDLMAAAASTIPNLDPAVRILRAMSAWWDDRDRAHLLGLPVELRTIAQDEIDRSLRRVSDRRDTDQQS